MDKTLMDTFWSLAEGTEAERISTVHTILNILKEKQSQEELHISAELSYALARLLRGLASNRKWARLGYSLALTQILRAFPAITADVYLDLLQKELKTNKTESKAELSGLQLGQVMGYLILLQSDRFQSANKKDVIKVLMSLNTIREKKPPLHHICSQGMVHIISKCGEKRFNKSLWPVLEPLLSDGWQTCTPDVLLLLLTAAKHQPGKVDKDFLSSKWSMKHLTSDKNFGHISNILIKSAVDHPIVHPVCRPIIQSAIGRPTSFTTFWEKVIEETLMKSSTNSCSYLGLKLVPVALSLITKTEQLDAVMSHFLVSLLIKNLSSKQQPLHSACRKLTEELVSFVKECPDGHLQVSMIKALLTSPGTVLFDAITKTKTVSSMITELNTNGAKEMSAFVTDLVVTPNVLSSKIPVDDSDSDDSDSTLSSDLVTQQKWALSVLSRLVTHVTMGTDAEWTLHILQFLFLHGCCVVTKPVKGIYGCEQKSADFEKSVISTLQATFFQSLNRLATFKPDRSSKSHALYVNTLYHMVTYAQSILDEKRSTIQIPKAFSEEVRGVWDKMREVVDSIRQKDEGKGYVLAFELLFLHHGLQLFTEPQSAVDVLQELHTCYQKATLKKRRQSVKKIDTDEPEWVDVVVDLLMSLLAQQNHLVRIVVNNVFLMLSPYLSSHSVQLILDTLESTPGEEEGLLDFEDDDDEDEQSESEQSAESVDENGEMESSDDESSDNESEEDTDEEEEVDDTLKTSLKDALGDAAIASDEDGADESDDDLDDEAMLKLDGALSAAFRSMKKSKTKDKGKETQLKHYQMRCLDILEILIGHNPSAGLLLKIILPLLRMMEKGLRDKSYQDLGHKATKVFHLLLKTSKLPPDPTVERSSLPAIFVELMEYAAKVPGIPMVKEVAAACLFVVRLMMGIEGKTGPSPVKTRAMKSASLENKEKSQAEGEVNLHQVHRMILKRINDFVIKRDTKLNPVFFHIFLEKEPNFMWPLAAQLVEFVVRDGVRIFSKTQACGMLATMINKNTVQNLDAEDWQDFVKSTMMEMTKLIHDMATGDLKPWFLHEVMNVIHKITVSASTELLKETISQSVVQEVWDVKKKVNKDTRGICNKFLGIVKNRLDLNPDIPKPVKKTKRKLNSVEETEATDGDLTGRDNGPQIKKEKLNTKNSKINLNLTNGTNSSKKKRKSVESRKDNGVISPSMNLPATDSPDRKKIKKSPSSKDKL